MVVNLRPDVGLSNDVLLLMTRVLGTVVVSVVLTLVLVLWLVTAIRLFGCPRLILRLVSVWN